MKTWSLDDACCFGTKVSKDFLHGHNFKCLASLNPAALIIKGGRVRSYRKLLKDYV